jgi:hypothetical protein
MSRNVPLWVDPGRELGRPNAPMPADRLMAHVFFSSHVLAGSA